MNSSGRYSSCWAGPASLFLAKGWRTCDVGWVTVSCLVLWGAAKKYHQITRRFVDEFVTWFYYELWVPQVYFIINTEIRQWIDVCNPQICCFHRQNDDWLIMMKLKIVKFGGRPILDKVIHSMNILDEYLQRCVPPTVELSSSKQSWTSWLAHHHGFPEYVKNMFEMLR